MTFANLQWWDEMKRYLPPESKTHLEGPYNSREDIVPLKATEAGLAPAVKQTFALNKSPTMLADNKSVHRRALRRACELPWYVFNYDILRNPG